MQHLWGCILVCCYLFLQGCSGVLAPDITKLPPLAEAVELTATPFFPQEKFQCGPAALATLLQVRDVAVLPSDLEAQVYLPKRKGSLQAELLAATRRYDRLPYVIQATPKALVSELVAGNPVLVLQNLGFSFLPRFHYAVVIGASDQVVILRSGEEKRLQMEHQDFLRSWKGGDYWAMVVLQPGQFPAGYNKKNYLEASAALEAAGRLQAAAKAYQALCKRKPGDCEDALFGMANVHFRLGEKEKAITYYRQLLALAPGHAGAINNLAEAFAQIGCHEKGFTLVSSFLKNNETLSPPLYELLLATQAELRQQLPTPQQQMGASADETAVCR